MEIGGHKPEQGVCALERLVEGVDEERPTYVVGFYGPKGFKEVSRHDQQTAARARVSYLNGGASDVEQEPAPASR